MGKLFLAIGVFLSSLVTAHQQPSLQHTAHLLVSQKTTPISKPTLILSTTPFPVNFSTYHFPKTNTKPLDTSNWVTYLDTDTGVKFQYPYGWKYYSPPNASSSEVTFKPAHAKSQEMGGNEYCVEAALLVNDYQTELQRLPIPYDGKFELEPITIANLPGVHFRASDYGEYIFNKDGKAIQFNYLILNGKDYGQEAEQMAQSLIFLRK